MDEAEDERRDEQTGAERDAEGAPRPPECLVEARLRVPAEEDLS
jgi:hypothetical protein